MMKKVLLPFLILCLGPFAADADYAEDCEVLDELFSARLSADPVRYARAAKVAFGFAKEGRSWHRFVLAALSREEDFPGEYRLDEPTRTDFLDRNRTAVKEYWKNDKADAVRRWREKNVNYVLWLEKNNLKDLGKAAQDEKLGGDGNEYAMVETGLKLLMDAKEKNMSGQNAKRRLDAAFDCFYRAAYTRDSEGDDGYKRLRNSSGLYNLGVCYQNGYGCSKNLGKARECFENAAKMGHPMALCAVGEMYRDGFADDGAVAVEKNFPLAMRYFEKSAATGNAYGQYSYAMALIQSGTNDVKAVEQLEKSARQRNHAAMIEYARCLYDSVGAESSYTNRLRGAELQAALEKISRERAERDHKAVAWWYHCAENLKDPVAMQYLAKCFMEGRGVDKNEMAAVSWYTRGAELGHIPSMLSLAQCYDEGLGGLEKSHYNANWWRTRADAERGVRNAKIWLKSHKLR